MSSFLQVVQSPSNRRPGSAADRSWCSACRQKVNKQRRNMVRPHPGSPILKLSFLISRAVFWRLQVLWMADLPKISSFVCLRRFFTDSTMVNHH